MAGKRRNSSSPECETPLPKRHCSKTFDLQDQHGQYDRSFDEVDEDDTDERPQLNAFTGQPGAFPGLSENDELFYGPASNGLDYLRMVRSEAKGIPQLLKAQAGQITEYNEYDVEKEGGYWDDDGTYTARPVLQPASSSTSLPKAQLQYYDSLLLQFNVVRATMKCVPPLSAIENLTSSQPISFPAESKNARMTWENCLKMKDPLPTQIACMDQCSVFELIKLITMKMRSLFQQDELAAIKRLGTWIWAVLGKCVERGELGSDEISELRQLAQKAIDTRDWLHRKYQSLQNMKRTSNNTDIVDIEVSEHELAGQIESARRRLAEHDASMPLPSDPAGCAPHFNAEIDVNPVSSADHGQQTKAAKLVILDMILVVVGEVYGQRDLLDLRMAWDTAESWM